MTHSNSDNRASGCIIGIPAVYWVVDGAPEYEPKELFTLCTRKHNLELVLGRAGLRLGEALYARDGEIFFGVFPIAQANETPVEPASVHQQLSGLLQRAQDYLSLKDPAPTSAQGDKVAGNQSGPKTDGGISNKDLVTTRKAIAGGPLTLSIGGEEMSWAATLKPDRTKRKQRSKFTLCRVTGSERHLVDGSDIRARPENPKEIENTQPGESVELLEAHTEEVLLVEINSPQPDLNFGVSAEDGK